METLFKILNEAMQNDHEKRPCEMYRKIICPKCASPKSCNDLDVIMCAMAKLLEEQPTNKGG